MNTRSRARNGIAGHEELEGGGENHNQQVGGTQGNPPTHDLQGERMNIQGEQGRGSFGAPPPPPLIQLTPKALRQLVEDASAQAQIGLLPSLLQSMVATLTPSSPSQRSSCPFGSRRPSAEAGRCPRRHEL
ncbi:UNVERIFIED_CONTAM: hypothetical protein Slati_2723300 [Sesamum latifolium]|uniref:Uncharacterized protein n=1 Tax=Sesamum latifolium TaxID=2727402 RepID=A0AAW2W0U3_9LAMI